MFTATLDKKPIYDPSRIIELIDPVLKRAENAAGSFEFEIAPDHPLYDEISLMTSEIVVYSDGEEIWSGRPVEMTSDFHKVKSVYCEGELSYLCDTIQPQTESHDIEVGTWLGNLLSVHNSKAPASRRFQLGIVTVYGTIYRYTNYESTMECITDKLIKRLGGHLRIRKVNGVRYLDYLADYPKAAEQEIVFGRNLLDYSKNLNYADVASVLVPLGAKQEESRFSAIDEYLTVASVNGGSIYVENANLVNTFGRVIKTAHWDDVTEPANLLTKARAWLTNQQFADILLEVKAVDFHLIDNGFPVIDMLDEVHVRSEPHDLNIWLPVSQMTLPLANPAGMTLQLGRSVSASFTSKAMADTQEVLESITPTSSILQRAKEVATDLITSGALGSHVVVLPDELYVTDNANIDSAKKVWRFNVNGLGYSKNGKNGPYGLAMTMDGAIVADRITTGTLNAAVIRAGILKDTKGLNFWNLETGEFSLSANSKVGGKTVSAIAQGAVDAQTQLSIFNKLTNNGQTQGIYLSGGKLYINASYIATGTLADSGRNTVFDLKTGTLTMKKGSISIGGKFSVSTGGVLTATGANITGVLKAAGNEAWCRLRDGYLEGAANAYSTSSINGWVGFNYYSQDSPSGYGLGLAGRNGIAFLSPALYVVNYVAPGGHATGNKGFTGNISYVSGMNAPTVRLSSTTGRWSNVMTTGNRYYLEIAALTSVSVNITPNPVFNTMYFSKGICS